MCREDRKYETVDSLITRKNKATWLRSLSNEWGCLAQGNDKGIKGTGTIDFIHRREVPDDKAVIHTSFICDYRPLKQEAYRIRITVRGNGLPYNNNARSLVVNLLEIKLLLNSTISDADKGARFMSVDTKDHFLAIPMQELEHMRVKY